MFAVDIDECGARIQHSQGLHDTPANEVAHFTQRRRPGRVMRNANLSSGKQSSPICAADRDKNQSSMRAIELDARRTKGSVSHAAGSRHVNRNST